MAAQVPSNGLNIDKGLKFPATANMQSDGNTLDDYEVGYYTVSFTMGSGSVGVNTNYDQAYYKKIGDNVFVQGYIEISSESSASGTARISLPFAIADLNDRADYACNALCFTIGSNNASTENGNWIVTVGGDGSVARLWRNSGTNVSDDVGDDVDSSCVFMLAFNYTTSA